MPSPKPKTTQKVTKAVIPAAGLGTRFLPATKAMPKEMLTVVNKPIIQYAIEEAYEAGIREFIIITGRGKAVMENHFDHPYELADTLQKKGKLAELESVNKVLPSDARIYYTRQGQPLGLGHAIACAAAITGDDPFAVLLPDDIICRDKENPVAEMIKIYQQTGQSVVLAEEVPHDRTNQYGILSLAGKGIQNRRAQVSSFVEKPKIEEAPSNLAIIGRYVLTPAHMPQLAQTKPGKAGEIQLTDAMVEVCKREGFMGYVSQSKRFDCGDKVGFQMANLYFAMQDPYIASRLQPFLHQTAAQYDRRREVRLPETTKSAGKKAS
ncbi:MAG: UTP--glucose-1-phosphate uridylyltransferase [Proteobacteria bacterium]|nr:UTP--glucose-1-phosphate uridylyltransferase [Pseudomonadota bacterium]NBX85866.1 UTP--glucose-1-phosphate uridylyltransferase [Pseudomonadota bacterium]